MSAFIGYGDVGVWATNSLRDDFLDWFADKRCVLEGPRWELCKSDVLRWPGCGVELAELIPRGESLGLTDVEYDEAEIAGGPHFAQLLGTIESITRGEWQCQVDSKAASYWPRPEGFQKQFGI